MISPDKSLTTTVTMASSSLSEAVDQTNSGAAGTDTGHLTATSGPLEGDSPPPYGGCHGRIDQVDEVGTGASITGQELKYKWHAGLTFSRGWSRRYSNQSKS